MSELVQEMIRPYFTSDQDIKIKKTVNKKDISLISEIQKYIIQSGDAYMNVFLKKPKECELKEVFYELGFYSNELIFYRTVGRHVKGIKVPFCYYSSDDGTLLLESIENFQHVSQMEGCDFETANKVIRRLATFHMEMSHNIKLQDIFRGWSKEILESEKNYFKLHCYNFSNRYPQYDLYINYDKLQRNYVSLWNGLDKQNCSLIHNDLRMDNIFWNDADVYFIDWQMVRWGNVSYDLSLFIVGNLSIEDRRTYCEQLVKEYFDMTHEGLINVDYEEFWKDFRLSIACHLLREINYLGEDEYNKEEKKEYLNKIFTRYIAAMDDYRVWELLN